MLPKTPTVYVITGTSRGIGLSIVKELCNRYHSMDIKIIGCVRNPAGSLLLTEVAEKYPNIVEIVKYVAADEANNQAIAQLLEEKYGHVDVLIPNAGISNYMGTVAELPISQLKEHVEVNSIAPLVLFQAFLPLLQASPSPKFIPITSGSASITYIYTPLGLSCYGGSKALLNLITRKIHFENEWLTSFPLAPGVIATDMFMSDLAKDATGFLENILKEFGVTAEQGGKMLVDIITTSTRETHGGEFINVDGSKMPW